MSIVIGMVTPHGITMAADTQATDLNGHKTYNNTKVFERDNLVFGVAGDLRAVNLLKHFSFETNPIRTKRYDYDHYFDIELPSEINEYLNKHGFGEGEDDDYEMIIGFNNKLYYISHAGDTLSNDDYICIGSGAPYALGLLYGERRLKFSEMSRDDSDYDLYILAGIDAAKHFDASCGGRVDMVHLEG